jgi:hypothetical protein
MPVRLTNICIDTVDPRPLTEFWMAVLGWEVIDEDDDGYSLGPPVGHRGPLEGHPGTPAPALDIMRVPEPKTVKNRLHLDLRADGTTTEAELQRLLALGATPVDVGQGPDVPWTVLSDPAGNEFCLLHRTVQDVEAEALQPG